MTVIALIPRPLSTPLDPLNWSRKRKLCIIGTLAFASFASDGAPPANLLAYNRQALVYHKEPTQVAYGTSAALSGFLIGPWTYTILFHAYGKSAVVFWGLVLQLLTQVWAALMTDPDDFVGYIVSRLFSGILATIPFAAGCTVIMEMFFLHQRGRLFALLELSFIFGVFVVPTIGGFLLQNPSMGWPWCFWWTVLLNGSAAFLILLFMEETTFDRDAPPRELRDSTASFVEKRILLFLFPRRKHQLSSRLSKQGYRTQFLAPMTIMVAPNIFAVGIFNMVCFGFATITGILVNILLQTPIPEGGYGFSPERNAFFSFTSWLAIAAGYLYGYLVGDRLPIMISRRRGGLWCPEYRLLNLGLPGVLLPIGLGVFAAASRYHLNVILLALGYFLVQFSAQIGIPICINYAVENFTSHPVAVVVAMNTLRVPFAIALPFAVTPWLNAVGFGWVFATAALLSLGLFMLVMVVVLKFGQRWRHLGYLQHLSSDEDSARIFQREVMPVRDSRV